jgi:hypothetical protein
MNEPTMTTINGGTEILVLFNDGKEPETVKVRQLPVKLMPEFSKTMGNEPAQIELYCDKPSGWSETLTPESSNEIADLGLELNLDFFGKWFRRQKRTSEAMNPGISEKIQKELSAAVIMSATNRQTSPSLDSSPASRSVAV